LTVLLAPPEPQEPFFATGGRTSKFTPGGILNGALPICEARFGELEKHRVEAIGKAGRRNEGSVAEGPEVRAFSSPFDRAVESIVAFGVGVDREAGELFWGREETTRDLVTTSSLEILGKTSEVVFSYTTDP
jgi:hypothetical protein